MRSLSVLILTTFLVFGCTAPSSDKQEAMDETTLYGEWVLTHEVFNNKTTDCKEDAIKTVLSLKENGYYMMYDDLSGTGVSQNLAKIQTLYQGQYTVHSDTLSIFYTVDDKDKDDAYKVLKSDSTLLVLENTRNKRQMHYKKK